VDTNSSNDIARLLSVELSGFKNVKHGCFEMPHMLDDSFTEPTSEILGIYGQNGSSKTAVLEALDFLRRILLGQSLPNDTAQFICNKCHYTCLDFSFFVSANGREYVILYTIVLCKFEEGHADIKSERLCYSTLTDGKRGRINQLVHYDAEEDYSKFKPSTRYNELLKVNKINDLNIKLARLVAKKEHKSFIFSEEFHEAWGNPENDSIWKDIIAVLHNYSYFDFFVFLAHERWPISANAIIPFTFKSKDSIGILPVLLTEPTVFEETMFNTFKSVLINTNSVINSIIPGFSIDIINHGPQLTEEGKDGVRFELVSIRDGEKIPLRYESEGIKRIIAVLNIIIAAYNNPSILVAIDELDAGIFEYLLGQVLKVFSETGKGQLIFTSHNLRPLELIDKQSVLFTTTNPNNRYIRLSNIKTTNNLRDVYYRSIDVGGQKEELYDPTEASTIRMALRKAGTYFDE